MNDAIGLNNVLIIILNFFVLLIGALTGWCLMKFTHLKKARPLIVSSFFVAALNVILFISSLGNNSNGSGQQANGVDQFFSGAATGEAAASTLMPGFLLIVALIFIIRKQSAKNLKVSGEAVQLGQKSNISIGDKVATWIFRGIAGGILLVLVFAYLFGG